MDIQKSLSGNELTFKLTGRLDTTTSPELQKSVEADLNNDVKSLVFDFSDLDYISSAGLRVLLSAQKKINSLGSSMLVKHPNEMIYEIFDTTGFTEIINIEK